MHRTRPLLLTFGYNSLYLSSISFCLTIALAPRPSVADGGLSYSFSSDRYTYSHTSDSTVEGQTTGSDGEVVQAQSHQSHVSENRAVTRQYFSADGSGYSVDLTLDRPRGGSPGSSMSMNRWNDSITPSTNLPSGDSTEIPADTEHGTLDFNSQKHTHHGEYRHTRTYSSGSSKPLVIDSGPQKADWVAFEEIMPGLRASSVLTGKGSRCTTTINDNRTYSSDNGQTVTRLTLNDTTTAHTNLKMLVSGDDSFECKAKLVFNITQYDPKDLSAPTKSLTHETSGWFSNGDVVDLSPPKGGACCEWTVSVDQPCIERRPHTPPPPPNPKPIDWWTLPYMASRMDKQSSNRATANSSSADQAETATQLAAQVLLGDTNTSDTYCPNINQSGGTWWMDCLDQILLSYRYGGGRPLPTGSLFAPASRRVG